MKANPFLWALEGKLAQDALLLSRGHVCHLGLTMPGSYVQSPLCPKAVCTPSSVSRKHRQKWSLLRRARASPLGCQHRESTWKSPGEDRWPGVRGDPGPRVTQLESQSSAGGPQGSRAGASPEHLLVSPPMLTFPGHLHRHAACRRPQVHFAAPCADGQPGLLRAPLEGTHSAQLLQHRQQSQLPDVPDPHGIGDAVFEEEGALRLTFTPRCSAPARSPSLVRMPTFPRVMARGREGGHALWAWSPALSQTRSRGHRGLGLSGCCSGQWAPDTTAAGHPPRQQRQNGKKQTQEARAPEEADRGTAHTRDGPLTVPCSQEIVVRTEGQRPDADPGVGSVSGWLYGL